MLRRFDGTENEPEAVSPDAAEGNGGRNASVRAARSADKESRPHVTTRTIF